MSKVSIGAHHSETARGGQWNDCSRLPARRTGAHNGPAQSRTGGGGMNDERYSKTIEFFDAANAEDPSREAVGGTAQPSALVYARRMSAWLERLAPDAPEPLRLAVRAQHIKRWTVPRGNYPVGRQGYHRWRADLARFHADTAAAIMRSTGYDEAVIARVGSLLRKERLKLDPETQILEDVACLVFLENAFADFARGHERGQVIGILRKTWNKMSERGHAAALALELPLEARALLDAALADAAGT